MSRSVLLVAATGLGKTAMIAGLTRHWPKGRVMVVSHRYELNQQAMAELSNICSEDVDFEQADYWADQMSRPHRIVVASVDTLNSKPSRLKGRYRMDRFRPQDFGLLLIDEAHHAAAPSYRRVVNHFRKNPDLVLVGVTATPDRLDGVGLGHVFEQVGCDLNLLWSIENGWLVPPKQCFVRVDGMDLRQVRTAGGDLDAKQLARIVELERNLHEMAVPIVDACENRKQAIVFTASVRQCHRLAEIIRDYHARKFGSVAQMQAVSIDGSLSPQDPRRRQIVKDFKEGRIQYLCNVGVATEGFNCPSVSVIAIGRPTKSRALYQQMMGRGTRPLEGVVDGLDSSAERIAAISASDKPHCLVLDFVGQSGRHKLVSSIDFMAGTAEPQEVLDRARKITHRPGWDGNSLDAIRAAREQLEAEREARRAKLTAGVDYELVETRTLYNLSTIPMRSPGYFNRVKVSDRQKSMLLRLGFTLAQVESMNVKSASKAIDYAIRHPRTGFGRWLNAKKKQEAGG